MGKQTYLVTVEFREDIQIPKEDIARYVRDGIRHSVLGRLPFKVTIHGGEVMITVASGRLEEPVAKD
ncbi:MAG: hypothetical protein HYX94_11405 [Chloroflexi bacterium]|nr:hypothetical protein [Chloroflexota bacterium]